MRRNYHMAVLTSSQQTFVDITDQRKLSAYITSNLPKTQSEDPNTLPHEYAPDWTSSNLVLTPVLWSSFFVTLRAKKILL